MEIPGFMINFSDGTAEMSITDLDHEVSFAKQSVMALIRCATRHGFCVDHALHDDWDLLSGGFGRWWLL
jgi:hypothetical protein